MTRTARSPSAARLSLRAPLIVGVVIVPLVLLLVALEMKREFARGEALREAVNHSFSERLQMQAIFSLVQDVETGQRGYVITGDQRYLEPYYAGVRQLDKELAKLEILHRTELAARFAAQPGEADNIARLKALVKRRVDLTRASIEIRRTRGAEAAAAAVTLGHGKAAMDQIRVLVARMTEEEADALRRRVVEHEAATRRTEQITLGLFLVLGVALIVAFVSTLRQWARARALLAEVRSTASRQTAIFESAQDGLITFNPSGTIESLNKAGETMFGRTRAELIRRDLTLLLEVPDSGGLFLERLTAGGDLQQGVTREITARRQDGSTFPVEATFGVFTLADGEHVVASVRDISERRRIDRMKAEFISTVSHELRTPLTSIAGSLGLLSGGAAGELPERAARLLAIASSNSQRLVRLINDILDMEKIESGQMAFSMVRLDAAELLRRAADDMGGLASELGVRIDVRAADDLPAVQGDPDRLIQVLSNLISNAAKFSPAAGVVEVTAQASSANRLRISVRDYGQGVPPEFHDRIFTKFAQADASDTRQKGGTGLGLAISREIVDRHGGRLWFENLQSGAVFHVELPAIREITTSAASRPVVLLCEDDPDISEVLRQMLEQEGFAVDAVATLAAAEARLAAVAPMALVLDVQLPDGNGLDLLKRIREKADTRRLPVLVISADPAARQAAPLEVIDWLQKPVDVTRLRAALETAVQEFGGRPLVLHVEDDMDVRQVVADALADHCEVVAAESLAEARKVLAERRPRLAILDIALGDGSGLELLPLLQDGRDRSAPVIIFSAQGVDEARLSASVDAVLTKSKASLEQLAEMVRRLSLRAAREGDRE